jgi:ubiquinol-cytochrome c reductase cytochrome c subunit
VLTRHRPALEWLAVLLAAAGAWLAVAAQAGAQTEPPADLVAVGTEIYSSQCATCHGFKGQGGEIPDSESTAPPLVGEGADVTLAYADLVIRTGRMPPPGDPFDNRPRRVTLDETERAAVLAFLRAEFDLPADIPDPLPGKAAEGQAVFATNCAACHGSTGAGGVAGAGAWTPRIDDLDPVAIAEAVRVGPFEMPAFSDEQLTDDELGDIAAFLHEVETEAGTPLGLIELNPVFASGFAAIFVLAVLALMRVVAGKPAYLPDPEGQHQPPETP